MNITARREGHHVYLNMGTVTLIFGEADIRRLRSVANQMVQGFSEERRAGSQSMGVTEAPSSPLGQAKGVARAQHGGSEILNE